MSNDNEWATFEKVRKYWWLGALLVVFLIVFFLASCGDGGVPFVKSEYDTEIRNALDLAGIDTEHSRFQHDYTTPGGAHIKSTVPVPAAYLGHTDAALRRQIDRYAPHAPAWTAGGNRDDLSVYTVLMVDPNSLIDTTTHLPLPPCVTEENDPGSSCLFINGIKSAGTIIGHDDRWDAIDARPAVVVAHQAANNWQKSEFYMTAVDSESQHLRMWLNRQNEPTGLFYHFQGEFDVHPLTFWQEPAGLVARPQTGLRSDAVK